MKQMSGFSTLKKLKELDNFNIPVTIMLKEDKKIVNEQFKKDGFDNCLLTDNLQKEFEKISNKYYFWLIY